jgi:hypothetical protein
MSATFNNNPSHSLSGYLPNVGTVARVRAVADVVFTVSSAPPRVMARLTYTRRQESGAARRRSAL